MQSRVCIVLNEREQLKARVAETLEGLLKERSITPFRIPIDLDIAAQVLAKQADIVVIDYLLGDHASGLDILEELNTQPEHLRPAVIFLTDEPGVRVAVAATQLGARDYIEIEHPKAVQKALDRIENILIERAPAASIRSMQPPSNLSQLVFEAKSCQLLLSQAKQIIGAKSGIVVIHGDLGTGKTTLAAALHYERAPTAPLFSFDLAIISATLKEALGPYITTPSANRLAPDSSVIIENIEEDTGELLELLPRKGSSLRGAPLERLPHIILTTSDAACAKRFSSLLDAKILALPKLTERREDIAPLTQYFLRQSSESLQGKGSSKLLSILQAGDLLWLRDCPDWPGNLTQLRSVVTDTAIRLLATKGSCTELFEEAKSLSERWLADDLSQDSLSAYGPNSPSRLMAALWFNRLNGDLRRVGAKLGVPGKIVARILDQEKIELSGAKKKELR